MKSRRKFKLVLIIPIKDESSAIEQVLNEIDALSPIGKDLKVVLVDDGSSDSFLLKNQREFDFALEILELRGNWGKESAMRAGLEVCRGTSELICFMDGDGQHPFAKVLEMMEILSGNPDTEVVIASPESRELVGNYGWARAILRKLLTENGAIDSDFMIIRNAIAEDLERYIEKSSRLRDLISELKLKTQTIRYIPRASFRDNKDRDSRWDLANLLVHSSIAVVNNDKKILKIVVLLGSLVSIVSIAVFSTVAIGSLLTGSRTGTASILLVMSLFFVFQIVLQILTFAYLRIVILELKARPSYFVSNRRKLS